MFQALLFNEIEDQLFLQQVIKCPSLQALNRVVKRCELEGIIHTWEEIKAVELPSFSKLI